MSGPAPLPSFATHLRLLWGLRVALGLNRERAALRWLAAASFVASSAPGWLGAVAAYQLMLVPAVAESVVWPEFLFRLGCFVTTCVWVAWPVMSAGVDDHSEVTRYQAFPISQARLLIASTLASVLEPRSLSFTGPLVGLAVGYARLYHPQHPVACALAFLAYVALNACAARVGMHAVLLVLRQARSAELLGSGFALSLIAAAFIPPVDTTWLQHLGELGAEAVPDTALRNAALALGRFPTGWFAHALTASARGDGAQAWADALRLLGVALVTLTVAHGLLLEFHRTASRGPASQHLQRGGNPFARTRSVFATLVAREAVDLFHNPRARLLVSVPFVLGILFKLLSGMDLLRFVAGGSADAWLLTSLCVYGAIVIGSTFSQNAFGYDGHGFAAFAASPTSLADVLRAKNVVHGGAGLALAAAVALFCTLYLNAGGPLELCLALLAAATVVATALALGNVLSVHFPVKFHANLKRRDKVPFVASMLGVAGAAAALAPASWALRRAGGGGPTAWSLGVVLLGAAAAGTAYVLTWPAAQRALLRRRELVLRAVTRD